MFERLKVTLYIKPFGRLLPKLKLPDCEYRRLWFENPCKKGLLSFCMCYLFCLAAAYMSLTYTKELHKSMVSLLSEKLVFDMLCGRWCLTVAGQMQKKVSLVHQRPDSLRMLVVCYHRLELW